MSRRSLSKRQRARQRNQRRAEARQQKRQSAASSSRRTAVDPVTSEARTVSSDLEWYMVRTEPRLSERALKGIVDAQAVAIVPRVSEVATRMGRRIVRSRQLILRTVFVGVRDGDHLDEIAAGAGIAGIVTRPVEVETEGNVGGFENKPARLDPVGLQGFVSALAHNEVVQPFGIKEGDPVVVMAGPFASFPGVVEKILPYERVRVAVSIFGKATSVELDIAQVNVAR